VAELIGSELRDDPERGRLLVLVDLAGALGLNFSPEAGD